MKSISFIISIIIQSLTFQVKAQIKFTFKYSFKTDSSKFLFNTPNKPATVNNYRSILKPVPDDYNNATLGAICLWEHQFQKATKFPLVIRLGSLNYTNYLEGKNKSFLLGIGK